MLSKEEIKEIDEAISMVPYKKAASIEALKIVQHHRKWVSDESLKEVAGYLEISADELDSVATFYNLIFRQPVGKHIILVCDSISCWVMGHEKIKEKLSELLNIDYGQTTADGRFTLLPNPCLGTCDCAPAIMVGNDLYRNLKTDELEKILSKYN
ncbi:MAG: NADH-ubiquinone oxidoreductase chain E [Cytophagales bacterium]|jgi:NADH-quinone oxidoreductase subunit E|nr:NADH-quinone oxidoreductase subunit NuoE [Bacteroidota bacterium]MBS1980851.1 NADH-quinone oxidoreductase subunit NuoE [Bacteroidota bacterium]WHZ08198.1 MAG: NADH-ubiquinone oxidoreductase chain E [Cytophagales bacterium]